LDNQLINRHFWLTFLWRPHVSHSNTQTGASQEKWKEASPIL
jgi:hypothetical protein